MLRIVDNIASLRIFLDENLPATLEMLRRMVEINSFTANKEGVNRLGRLTAEFFRPLGFSAEFVAPSSRRKRNCKTIFIGGRKEI